MSNSLRLSLKREWFEMTKAGIKTEDYREITAYWAKRLVGAWTYYRNGRGLLPNHESFMNGFRPVNYKNFQHNIMTLGYPSAIDTERILRLEHKGIEIGYGKPEWGAEPNKLYFVIKHGTIIEGGNNK
jgi:hypothetical protein